MVKRAGAQKPSTLFERSLPHFPNHFSTHASEIAFFSMQIKTKLFLLFSDAGRGHCGWCRMLCKVLPAIRPCLTFHERATQVNIFKLGITTVFSRAELRGITFFFLLVIEKFSKYSGSNFGIGRVRQDRNYTRFQAAGHGHRHNRPSVFVPFYSIRSTSSLPQQDRLLPF